MTKNPNFAKDQLRSLVERVERLEEEKRTLGADIREVYAEAKGHGFDTTIMRQVVRLRGMDSTEREERDTLLELYMSALGMAGDRASSAGPSNVVHMAQAAE